MLTGAAVREPQPVLLSVLDASDGLDLGGLTVRAPVPPVLVVSTVSLTLHDVLLASVARVLVAHKAAGKQIELAGTILGAVARVLGFSATLGLLAGMSITANTR